MVRLDRVYSSKEYGGCSMAAEYVILADNALSDHLPVMRQIELVVEEKRKSSYVISAYYLKEQTVKDRIHMEWAAHLTLSFFRKLRRCVRICKQFCISKGVERRREEELLRKSLEEATTNLQADPENGQWQAEVARCIDGLQKLEKWKVKGELLRNRVKWKSVGDQCSKELFQATREKSIASHITGLADRFGMVHTSQAAMQQICQEYYKTLYTTRPRSVASEEAKKHALQHVTNKLMREMKTKLCAPLQLGELQAALKDMKGNKSLGPDGVILEFYKEFWSLIGQEYLEMLLANIQAGKLPPGVTTGMIALLHKRGQRTILTNWRLITLLNLSFKIYVKAL
jgi:hypothetical protein